MLVVFSKSNCDYCRKLKETLKEEGKPFEEIILDDPAMIVAFKMLFPKQKTVPLIVKSIGGYEDYISQ